MPCTPKGGLVYVYRTVRGVYRQCTRFLFTVVWCELTKNGYQEFAVHASYTKSHSRVRVPYCTRRVPAVYAFFTQVPLGRIRSNCVDSLLSLQLLI
jgi:hypothetical protein